MWTTGIIPLEATDVATTLHNNKFLVIYFYATYDAADRLFSPILETVATEYADRIVFRSVNTEDEELADFVGDSKVVCVPCLSFLVKGQPVKSICGLLTAEALRVEFSFFAGDSSMEEYAAKKKLIETVNAQRYKRTNVSWWGRLRSLFCRI